VAIAVAQVNIKREAVGGLSLIAMPNVREKDISILARYHEPASFSQFFDNHERRPLVEMVATPKLLLNAMELLAGAGASVDVPIAALLEEVGEGGVISHLVDKKATVRLEPATRKPVEMTSKPPTTLGTTSLPPVLTEKQKALAKLSALAPLTNGAALSATSQLSHAEWLQY
jgi:hypothetical protein